MSCIIQIKFLEAGSKSSRTYARAASKRGPGIGTRYVRDIYDTGGAKLARDCRARWPWFVYHYGKFAFLFIPGSLILLLFSTQTLSDPVRATIQSAGQGSAAEMVPSPTTQREEKDTARTGSDYSLASI